MAQPRGRLAAGLQPMFVAASKRSGLQIIATAQPLFASFALTSLNHDARFILHASYRKLHTASFIIHG
jgi:hypothetical protein